jgi:hypothetical protein
MGFVDCIQGRRSAAREVQHPYQWQTHWASHPSTAEALKHEKNLFSSCAGPFATADRARVLGERIEGLASQQHVERTRDGRRPSVIPQPDQRLYHRAPLALP